MAKHEAWLASPYQSQKMETIRFSHFFKSTSKDLRKLDRTYVVAATKSAKICLMYRHRSKVRFGKYSVAVKSIDSPSLYSFDAFAVSLGHPGCVNLHDI